MKEYSAPPPGLPFYKEEIEGSIITRFERVVNHFANQLAVSTPGLTLTYDELDKRSNQVAHAILSHWETGKEPIALLLGHDAMPIIAILGVLKTGKCYVALDPLIPHSQLLHILEDSQAGVIITNDTYIELARKFGQAKQLQLINLDRLDGRFPNKKIELALSPDTLMALLYTSGSTGQMKGVCRSHRNTLYSAGHAINTYYIGVGDHCSGVFSYSFAGAVGSIFPALLNGATFYPYDVKQEGVVSLADWLIRNKMTIFRSPVSFWRNFLDTLTETEVFLRLRLVILGGQVVYARDVEQFRKYVPENCVLLNRLGSTETGTISEFVISRHTEITSRLVPVGYVAQEKEVFLLDTAGQKVGVNETGEIAVRSRYLAPGYWNDPELTRRKFLSDPEGGNKRIYLTGDLGQMHPDGCLEYFGRKDLQVKIRGYRVILTEIEAALYTLDTIKDVVVIACEHEHGDPVLVAYVVASRQPAPTVNELRRALAEILPEYMIPSRFVFMKTLPLTSTGKVDRRALPEPPWIRPELEETFVAPGTPIESLLAEIWQGVLGLDRVGMYDNFFDLGGHSLLAMQMIAKVERKIGIRLKPRDLIYQTLGQVASVCEENMKHLSGSNHKKRTRNVWDVLKNEVFCRKDKHK